MRPEQVADVEREHEQEHDSQLASQILDYFRSHPQAKDSVEGIARFWVNADPIEVRRALDALVEMELVEVRKNASMDLFSLRAS